MQDELAAELGLALKLAHRLAEELTRTISYVTREPPAQRIEIATVAGPVIAQLSNAIRRANAPRSQSTPADDPAEST